MMGTADTSTWLRNWPQKNRSEGVYALRFRMTKPLSKVVPPSLPHKPALVGCRATLNSFAV
jgi:hypothetical protein